MRSGRAALLTLLLLCAARASLAGASRAEPPAQAPLGEFVPASPPRPAPAIGFADCAGKDRQPRRFRRQARARQFVGHLVRAVPQGDAVAGAAANPARRQDRDPRDIRGSRRRQGGGAVCRQARAQQRSRSISIRRARSGSAFKVDGLPTSFLIDRQGRVLGRVEGERRVGFAKDAGDHRAAARPGRDRQDVRSRASTSLRNCPPRRKPSLVDRMADARAGQALDRDAGGFEPGFGLGQRRKRHERVLGAVNHQDRRPRAQFAGQQFGGDEPARIADDAGRPAAPAAARQRAT